MNSINEYINVHTPAGGKKFGTWQNWQSKHQNFHGFLTLKSLSIVSLNYWIVPGPTQQITLQGCQSFIGKFRMIRDIEILQMTTNTADVRNPASPGT